MSTAVSGTLLTIQQQTTRYIYSIYLIFGVTGCCLNILLLSRRQFRMVSCCTYFITASVTMLINLGMGVGSTMYALDHVDPNTSILAFCKMRIYVNQSSSMMYRWCLTVACIDRYTTLSINVNLRNFAKVYIARRVVVIIVALWFVLPVHTLIFYNLKDGGCGILYNRGAALYHSIFTTVAGSLLPTSIMSSCLFLIYRNLILKGKRRQIHIRQQTEPRNEIEYTHRIRDQQALAMLLVQILFYVTLITPLMAFYFYNAITLNVPNKSADRLSIERFALYIAELIIYLFPVSSFYLYTVASHKFRGELRKLIRSVLHCTWLKRTHQVEPTTNSTTRRRLPAHRSALTRGPRWLVSNRISWECSNEFRQQQIRIT